ncbi:MAG TPA: penicillin acylase family protein [Anaerolineae bacterium]|nr:penicillin acylase family protein [Anaerolineae bacterium]
MRVIRRIVSVVLILVLVLGAVGAGGFLYLARRAFPQIDGAVHLSGLTSPVRVIRDKYGIPHIYASMPADLFFAQGYVHAQDRLWQMEIARRAVAGRRSELSPNTASLEADRYVRTIGLRRAAEADYEVLSAAGKAVVQAYTEGVNAFISTHGDSLPIEFFIIGLFGSQGVGYAPEPWTPVDTMQWAKALAYDQSGSFSRDLFYAEVLKKFGEEEGQAALADLAPAYDYQNRPVIVPEAVAWERLPSGLAQLGEIDSVAGAGGLDTGSNSWTVAGSRTTTGQPLLANDPHIEIQMPAIWYFNGLHCQPVGPECPYEVIGASLLGVPGVIIGHNARVAWGLTNSSADMRDLFLEKVEGDAYEFQGNLVKLESIPEVLKIKGRLPADYTPALNETSTYDEATNTTAITWNVRSTRHGPLVSDIDKGAAQLGEYAVAYAWTGISINAPDGFVDAVLGVNRAQNWDEFRAAVHLAGTPSMNVVYADVDGNIGYQTIGRIPIRAAGDGRLPVPGWTGEYEWTDHIPTEELPVAYNPPQGYLVTANNAITGPDYPYLIATDYDRGYRAQRIVDLIESSPDGQLSPDDFARIQGDSHNLAAEAIVSYLAGLTAEGDVQKLLDAIRGWDFANQRDSVGAGGYEVFFYYLVRNTFADELGDLMRTYVSQSGGGGIDRLALIRLLDQPNAHWWDDVTTDEKVEAREDIIRRSLNNAATALTAELGADPAGWTWGKLHTLTFKSQALGDQIVGFFFNRGPFAVDGGQTIVNNTGYNTSEGYPNPDRPNSPPARLVDIFRERQSPSLRQIVDLGDLNRSRFIFTLGQSGLPLHPHYDDLIELWRNNAYVPMWWDRADIEQNAEGTFNLTP